MRAVPRSKKKANVVAIQRSLVTTDGLTCYLIGVLVGILEHLGAPYGETCCLRNKADSWWRASVCTTTLQGVGSTGQGQGLWVWEVHEKDPETPARRSKREHKASEFAQVERINDTELTESHRA